MTGSLPLGIQRVPASSQRPRTLHQWWALALLLLTGKQCHWFGPLWGSGWRPRTTSMSWSPNSFPGSRPPSLMATMCFNRTAPLPTRWEQHRPFIKRKFHSRRRWCGPHTAHTPTLWTLPSGRTLRRRPAKAVMPSRILLSPTGTAWMRTTSASAPPASGRGLRPISLPTVALLRSKKSQTVLPQKGKNKIYPVQ